MFKDLNVFALASARMAHATQRQAVVARNVANADTPGFKAKDTESFASFLAERAGDGTAAKATRPGHAGWSAAAVHRPAAVVEAASRDEKPDGNTVSLESQMVASAELRHDFDLANAVYGAGLGLVRAVLGRGR